MQDGGWAWGLLTPLMIFIVFSAIIVGLAFLVVLIRRVWTSAFGVPGTEVDEEEEPPVRETPLEIVERRYALGELERKEYLQKVKDLTPKSTE